MGRRVAHVRNVYRTVEYRVVDGGFRQGNDERALDDKCLVNVREGESIFILRGQDRLAPLLVRTWAVLAFMCGIRLRLLTSLEPGTHALGFRLVLPTAKCKEAWATARLMAAWTRRKFPD